MSKTAHGLLKNGPQNFYFFVSAVTYAELHWAQKLVFTSFPGRNIVPLKSEVVFLSGKLRILRASDFRLGNTSWVIRVCEPNGTQHYFWTCQWAVLDVAVGSFGSCHGPFGYRPSYTAKTTFKPVSLIDPY